jgi:hypothetical protein
VVLHLPETEFVSHHRRGATAAIGKERRMLKMAKYLAEQRLSPGPASYLDVQSVQSDAKRLGTLNAPSEGQSLGTTGRRGGFGNTRSLGTIEQLRAHALTPNGTARPRREISVRAVSRGVDSGTDPRVGYTTANTKGDLPRGYSQTILAQSRPSAAQGLDEAPYGAPTTQQPSPHRTIQHHRSSSAQLNHSASQSNGFSTLSACHRSAAKNRQLQRCLISRGSGTTQLHNPL